MKKMIPLLALVFALVHGAARAADAPAVSEEYFRYTKLYYDDTVAEDGTESTKTTIGLAVLRPDAVESAKEYPISYSTSAEKVEVLEAYTQKPDGRRIDAPKNNFQVHVDSGRDGAPPAFSDESSLTIVFPDVEVGDTINVVYNRQVTDPLFPRQFSESYKFYRSQLYDDVRISYSIPLSLNARYRNYGLTETQNSKDKDRQHLAWTFKNTEVKKTKYTEIPVKEFGDEPSVIISTFPSYQSFAESYGARAKPKAAVTDEVRKIADDATKGITDPKEQAKALYNWEIETLTYAGNCIGIGAVVPRDLDFVLKNKMGDCKDHATLLQALLAAKGIESTQALIGYNSLYTLPEIPLVDVVNHVIDYIPSMDLFLDATSGMPFGTLPFQLTGKPVLLVDGYKDGMTTPRRAQDETAMKTESTVTIGADGAADGVITVRAVGPEGGSHYALQQLKGLTPKKLEDAGQYMLKASGYQGTVKLDKGIWDEKSMTYTSTIHYHLKDYIHMGAPGAIYASAPFSSQRIAMSFAPVIAEMSDKDAIKPPHGFVCGNGTFEETTKFVFPPGVKILAAPDDVSVKNAVQDYEAKYTTSGQTITANRRLLDTSPAPLCPTEVDDEYREVALKGWADMKAQIVYK